MDTECASHEISSSTEKTNVVEVESVVQSWMVDYYFATLCRHFKARSGPEFHKALKIFEALVDELESCSHRSGPPSQRTICCLLARVIDGEQLDVHYDRFTQITPLMSALPIWESLKEASDTDLHAKIKTLLIVQSVAVCVKKGNSKLAKETLQWLEKETEIPEKLQGKLTAIVSKKDAFDPLLMNLTFNQLLENIDMFLDAFSLESPSVFLLEAASKVVEARHERSEKTLSEQDRSERMPSSPESIKTEEDEAQVDQLVLNMRPKRKLLSKQTHDPWKPDTAKKERPKRTSICKVSRRSSSPSELQSDVSVTSKTRRKWTAIDDRMLKAGVKKHGEGNWSRILNDFEFNNRTGVNLKDRWRTLKSKGEDF
ncbi:telomeric repeat-binding factor 1 [Rhinichthys klamathensis goyatoka]|uniref:telomeric repeat-binding factor 1 n=1 Tax=Rhinichthys klamathensis goyatoka TaxID=3034132 RepID=UPI0024B55DE9|nr:telomeric repeat-binding factor 1 [Rhinichthys klamathensis goyatoka]